MTLEQIKKQLPNITSLNFKLQTGEYVPNHFHITEVGLINKHFIDCGGVIRKERVVNFQLWSSTDTDHRLKPQKLLNIINLAQEKLGLIDGEIEVEYQSNTIGKYRLEFDGIDFTLLNMQTACLASDACGVNEMKPLSTLQKCCSTESNCC
ncbi:MAG: DUF6428 family protein [Bacteroidetes bacterium]|nr:DUF6428 family protein [Bacteroidota bacterium]